MMYIFAVHSFSNITHFNIMVIIFNPLIVTQNMETLYHVVNSEKTSCASQITAASQRHNEMRATYAIVANEAEVCDVLVKNVLLSFFNSRYFSLSLLLYLFHIICFVAIFIFLLAQ